MKTLQIPEEKWPPQRVALLCKVYGIPVEAVSPRAGERIDRLLGFMHALEERGLLECAPPGDEP